MAIGTILLLIGFIVGFSIFLLFRDLFVALIKEALGSSIISIGALALLNVFIHIPISWYGPLFFLFFITSAGSHFMLNYMRPKREQFTQQPQRPQFTKL